jgi:hypothetical protein
MWFIPAVTLFLVVLPASLGAWAGEFPEAPLESPWRSARYYGGSDFEFAERMTVDAQGNAYLLGRTSSGDMYGSLVPIARDGGTPASATFVLKLDAYGRPTYVVPVGTGFSFMPLDIAVGIDGAVHVLARDGDVTHVVKIDASGGRREYHVTFNGLAGEGWYPKAISADDAGHTVLAGWSRTGLFVARLDTRGAVFDAHRIPVNAVVADIAVDAAGDVYIVGSISGEGLPTTVGALQPRYNGGQCGAVSSPVNGPSRNSVPCLDGFLLKVARDGNVAYATYFGGSDFDEGHAVAVDRTGAAVISGITRSIDLPTLRAIQPECKAGFFPLVCGDLFVAKIDPTGRALMFSTFLGGTDTENVYGIAVDEAGSVYVGGIISGSGLPVYRAPQPENGGGRSDGFAVALGPLGDLRWSTYVGGPDDDRVVGVGAATGIVHIGGETMSPEWALGGDAFHGARDLFSAQLLDLRGR